MKPITIAILGAGGRGQMFAELLSQDPRARVVAIAEPNPLRRANVAKRFSIEPGQVDGDWRDFVRRGRTVDAVVIATQDQEHLAPAVACMELGCDVLLEKPMAVTLEDCRTIDRTRQKTGAIVGVCHSLRYNKAFRMVKEVIDSGVIGRVVTVDLIEQVAWWHQAHSFVRGSWGNSRRSTFMLMSKSCHDIDYIHYLVGGTCRTVNSFGGLAYFKPEHAPAGATERCIDCPVERDCAYSAVKLYVTADRTQWPASVAADDHSKEAHLEAIHTGPYGRCVWRCDNDVVDHQTVNMLFDNDVTVTFTMTAFTQDNARKLRVNGTLGELAFDEQSITVRTFADGNQTVIRPGQERGGHGGGDARVVRSFVDAVVSKDPSKLVTGTAESLQSHTVVFAAEQSRLTGKPVELKGFAG